MIQFPSAYKTAVSQRSVQPAPLITITLIPDLDGTAVPTAYISDRDITVNGQLYQKRLEAAPTITATIDGSPTTATVVLSNIDRVMNAVANEHIFYHAQVTYSIYIPATYTLFGGTHLEAIHLEWVGYCATVSFTEKDFTLNCTSGFAALSLPFPRRRILMNCDNLFDDGCFCPYSGYGNKGAGSGSLVAITDMAGVVAECPAEFDSDISGSEGHNASPGITTCDKTFSACMSNSMTRFFQGTRYVASWAAGSIGGFLGMFKDNYVSYSSANETVFNQPMPSVYAGGRFILNGLVFQWRDEQNFVATEAFISSGVIKGVDGQGQSLSIGDVYVNGLPPTNGQHPATSGFAISRGSGRIGESLQWDEIGGDLKQTSAPSDPPIHFSFKAGVFIRVADKSAGINSPSVGSKNTAFSPQGVPNIQIELNFGRTVWAYSNPGAFSRYRTPSDTPSWTFLQIALESLEMDYATQARHMSVIDMQSFVDHAAYCNGTVPSLVDGSSVQRYAWRGSFSENRPATDALDSVLRDCDSYRLWRSGLLAVKPFTACQPDTIPRPGFQEFVNVVDNSLKSNTVEPKFNQANMSYSDVSFDFQKNTASVYSETHQIMAGQGRRHPLGQSFSLTGTFTTDQATRLGLRLVKREIGGTNQQEWQDLREITLVSTIMMGELELGDVTFLGHTMAPQGGDWYQVVSRTLKPDYSIEFKLRTHRASYYDDLPTGFATNTPAAFAASPYLPGSSGIVYKPLPAMNWQSVDFQPNGVLLTWAPYGDANDNLLFSVQIFRSRTDNISTGGFLNADISDTDTNLLVYVGGDWSIYSESLVYTIDFEQVLLTAVPDTTHIVVTRGYNGTAAVAHKKYTQVRSDLFLDRMPDAIVAQFGTDTKNQYLDPLKTTAGAGAHGINLRRPNG